MKKSLFMVLMAGFIALFVAACSAKAPITSDVDEDVKVSVYLTSENGHAASVCLLEETVHVSQLVQYPQDDGVTVPFNFSDTAQWAEITECNIGKRVAISINGYVVSTPVVKMRLENGACSVTLPRLQISTVFPHSQK